MLTQPDTFGNAFPDGYLGEPIIPMMKSYCFLKNFALAVIATAGLFVPASLFAATNEFTPAKSLVIRAWGTEQGLPQNTVNAITQTHDGYLWLGTQEGLARFDGVRFAVFGLRDGLPSVWVHALCEDNAGILWIGTSGGLSRLVNGRIENVPLPARLGTVVNVLKKDAAGQIWVGTSDGVGLYQNGNFIEDQTLARLGAINIQDLIQDHVGDIWIASGSDGLFRFDHHGFTPIPGPAGHEQIVAHCLLADSASNVWVSIGNGLVLRRSPNAEWTTYTESNGVPYVYVSCMTQEADGTIWAGSLDDGVYRLTGDHFTALRREDGLSANDIRSLYPDREGNLWIGTRIGGLNRLSRSKLITYGVAQGLTNDYTRGIAESATGTLWVGTIGGGLYFGNHGKFNRAAPEIIGTNNSTSFYFAFINSVLVTTNNTVWYGGVHGLMRIQNDILTDCFNKYPFASTAVTALCDDGQGKIWVGTADSRLFHFENGSFALFPKPVARGTITSLVRETNGTLWIGSEAGGLKCIEPDRTTVLAFTNGLVSQAIRTLYLDTDGTLWIGTLGGGLSRYRDGQIASFTTQQGLWADTISQIVPDENGNLWCGCNHGIFRISKVELNALALGRGGFIHPRVFGINDGMLAEECSGGFCPAGLKTQAGLIGFSTVKGLVFVNPDIHTKTQPREALLEEVVAAKGQNNRTENSLVWNLGDPQAALPIEIPPGAWEIEFHYSAINLSSPESILFRYRLLGLDQGWIEAGARRTAYYHHLPQGNYTFEVEACSSDGIWGDPKASPTLTMHPYFWETHWFRLTAASGVFLLLAWLVRNRYRQRLARLEMQHAVEKERVRIAKDIHDDIGGILTQVSQISDLGLGQSERSHQSALKDQFERIGQQSRAAVQALDEIVWATNPKNDNLPHFAEYVSRFADEFFENSEVRCWQEVPTDLPDLPLRSNVRHNIFLAIKEAFNNILKHSRATEVWLRIALTDGSVCIEIEDNGRGFAANKITTGGNGLDNMRTRLEECRGHGEFIPLPPSGTKVRFTFPLPKAD